MFISGVYYTRMIDSRFQNLERERKQYQDSNVRMCMATSYERKTWKTIRKNCHHDPIFLIMEVVDSHFHLLDLRDHVRTGHNASVLGDMGKAYPEYTAEQYIRDLESSNAFTIRGAVHVEAISDSPRNEAQWVDGIIQRSGFPSKQVARVDLHTESAAAELTWLHEHVKSNTGIRQILNHHPTNPALTYPRVPDGDLLRSNVGFAECFSKLADYNYSFDLQCNPHQLSHAYEFLKRISRGADIPVVINHLGCLKFPTTDFENGLPLACSEVETWRMGLRMLSQLPNTYLKISFFPFTLVDWRTHADFFDLVREAIDMFGPARCMFGSNFPVDLFMGTTAVQLRDGLEKILQPYTASERASMLSGTAANVYNIDL